MKWKKLEEAEARKALIMMKRLPISCDRYSYFSTAPHPMIKFDSRKKVFYSNEYYSKLILKKA